MESYLRTGVRIPASPLYQSQKSKFRSKEYKSKFKLFDGSLLGSGSLSENQRCLAKVLSVDFSIKTFARFSGLFQIEPVSTFTF